VLWQTQMDMKLDPVDTVEGILRQIAIP